MSNLEGIDARPLLTRRLAWDMLPHHLTPLVLSKLGLVPASADNEELEHHDSHVRLAPLLDIEEHLTCVLEVVKDIMCAAMLVNQDEEPAAPLSQEVVGEIVRASCVGMLAHLVNTEVVQVNDGLKC